MSELETTEIKAFVPARDFALSKQFYQDLGFELAWSSEDLAYLHHGNCSFLLQNFYVQEHADNFMMHLLVTDVDAWWRHVEAGESRPNTMSRQAHRKTALGAFAISHLSIRLAFCGGSGRIFRSAKNYISPSSNRP